MNCINLIDFGVGWKNDGEDAVHVQLQRRRLGVRRRVVLRRRRRRRLVLRRRRHGGDAVRVDAAQTTLFDADAVGTDVAAAAADQLQLDAVATLQDAVQLPARPPVPIQLTLIQFELRGN